MRYTGEGCSPNVETLLTETRESCPTLKVHAADDFWTFVIPERHNTSKKKSTKPKKSNAKEEEVKQEKQTIGDDFQ